MKNNSIKVMILTTNMAKISVYKKGQIAGHGLWGIVELDSNYNTVIYPVKDFFNNTYRIIKEDYDVLYMHNINPIRFFPAHLLKSFIPSFRKKKIICLCHASVFGKSRNARKYKYFGFLISWLLKGYDKFLFFSQKSMVESIRAGLDVRKCIKVHWGADIEYINSISKIEWTEQHANYWLSSGRENRDFLTMNKVAEMANSASPLLIMEGGAKYKEVIHNIFCSKGCIVITNAKGLNYCTGLTCIVEAIALGKPIIAVRNPYYPFNIEDEGCGVYVDQGNASQIVNAINTIENDSYLYKKMCYHSKRLSKTYNLEIFNNELIGVINTCLSFFPKL